MKGFIQVALAATLVAGVAAQPRAHQHRHSNAKRHEHAVVEKRDAVTVTSVVPATVTVYVLEGQEVDIQQAQNGIKGGEFIVVGSTTPTFTPPPSPPSSTSTTSSSSSTEAAQFFELKSSSSSSSSSSSAVAPSASPTAAATSAVANGTSGASGVDVPFPTGADAPPCGTFPSQWGALALEYLGNNGWASIQTPSNGFTPGVLVANIVTPNNGGCQPSSFCAHACPPGYQSTQWPETSQGASGQSVGGLWCDSNGKLQLTRPTHPTICEAGAGGVSVKNSLSSQVAVCRTVYPGTESMVIPLDATPGSTFPLTNPDANTYYKWEGKFTSAQYYINPAGMSAEDACQWTNPKAPFSSGNWAPKNIGVGKDATGTTYISIFNNAPTSTAELDYNVRITGDVSIVCAFENGAYSNGDANGCTTAITHSGGQAVIEFY